MDNTLLNSAWTNITALCLPLEQLKDKYGLTWVHPRNTNELRLSAGDYTLVVTQHGDKIFAVIENGSRVPEILAPERKFAIDGVVDCPVLVETGSATSKRISEVFEDLANWVHEMVQNQS